MKLLLTSDGITNKTIENALWELVDEKEIRTAFIPTAANILDDEKGWLIENYNQFKKLGPVDIIELSAVPKNNWLKRLQKANVIVFGGGSTKYLMEQVKKSGLEKELPSLLKKRVYVGISAGSMITNETIWMSSEYIYDEEENEIPEGLKFTPICFRPHYKSPYFPKVNDDNLTKISRNNSDKLIYAMDDNSALQIVDNNIKILTEGEYNIFPNTERLKE